MKRMFLMFAMLFLLTCAASLAQDKCGDRAQVLIVGTYHMGNPGADLFNMKADDVLAPKRQQEMEQVADVLKRYAPTKIAVESDVETKTVATQYKGYLDGSYSLRRNEIDQIGHRLAKRLGHKQVYPIDVQGEFPAARVVNFATAKGLAGNIDREYASAGEMVKRQEKYVQSHTVLESLVYMNSAEAVREGLALYASQSSYGEPGDYAGPDLLAEWYRRNIRIHNNMLKLIESPKDRVLVIYGAGHLPWLQQNVNMDPRLCLRTLDEFLDKVPN